MSSQAKGQTPGRLAGGRACKLPGQDTDMLDATALCDHHRVKSVHMVSREPRSKSRVPSGRGRPPLASGTLVKSPKR